MLADARPRFEKTRAYALEYIKDVFCPRTMQIPADRLLQQKWHDSDRLLARIIHERLLQRPILSPGGASLVRSPRRTARSEGIKKRSAHEDTARSLSRGRPHT
jgi:hypothetical protein